MSDRKSSFVHLCQQLLAAGALLAVAAPAAGVVTMDMGAPAPSRPAHASPEAVRRAPLASSGCPCALPGWVRSRPAAGR